MKTTEKKSSECHSSSMHDSAEMWNMNESENCESIQYREMSLSVSRMCDGEQTDIRIHRETGKPTDIYVSRGGESWNLSPKELDELPHDLHDEVKSLLHPSTNEHWERWCSIFSLGHESDKNCERSRMDSDKNCEHSNLDSDKNCERSHLDSDKNYERSHSDSEKETHSSRCE